MPDNRATFISVKLQIFVEFDHTEIQTPDLLHCGKGLSIKEVCSQEGRGVCPV